MRTENKSVAMDKKRKKKVTINRIDKTMSKGPQLQGYRPFKVKLSFKMSREHCEKIRRFLKRQSANSGRSIANILSQSVSPREVSFQ